MIRLALWTLRFALAGPAFVTPCWVLMLLAGIVFVKVPGVDDVTGTEMMQVAPGAMVPPVRVTEVAVDDGVPLPQAAFNDGAPATVTLAGRLSVTETLVRAVCESLFLI